MQALLAILHSRRASFQRTTVFLNGRPGSILLKKSVSERATFRQLKKRSISALLRKNQYSSAF